MQVCLFYNTALRVGITATPTHRLIYFAYTPLLDNEFYKRSSARARIQIL